jgi:16S rRNA (uracil1498-N3)-methyltransferase
VAAPVKLKDLAGDIFWAESVARVVLAESEKDTRLRDVLAPLSTEVALAVGPEGGWADDEFAWFRETGWAVASLGGTILRAETAAIVATALAMEALR